MLSLPALKEDGKQLNSIKNNSNDRMNSGNHQIYDYFSIKISKATIEMLFNNEKDERYLYFLRYGFLRRYEGKGDVLYVEIPQIPKNIVIYRKPSVRNKNSEKLYLNKKDLPHIPLLEGEENLKLLSLETNLISKIDHLISLNNLLFLNLYENRINEIENLQTVPKLKALMLGKNNISKIKNLQCLPDIEVLDLHSNKIKLIENLISLKKLRILNLANNQLTSFVELKNNKNLEDINLRKNLIVSIPDLTLSFDKLKKINLGKNMIAKTEFILEFKKLKRIEELYIEGNPVIFIKDAYKKFYTLPLKFKDKAQFQIYKNNINTSNNTNNNANANNNGLNNSVNQFKNNMSNKNNNGGGGGVTSVNESSNIRHTSSNNFISTSTASLRNARIPSLVENNKEINNNNDINNNNITNKSKSKQSTRNDSLSNSNNTNNNRNNGGNTKGDQDNLSEEERERLLNKIENEWKIEFKFIINNGYNGYSVKKMKDMKMQLCHAEIERDKQLNLFGNAIEVLGYKEFYNVVHTIKFEFINFDIISQRQNIENIKKFSNLKSLIFKSNNMHGFYQIIKLENIRGIEYITIRKNEICNGEILKYFLVYRLQNIKFFNDNEITNKDVLMSKKIFENFDQAISICANEAQRLRNTNNENGSSFVNKKDENKNEVEKFELNYSFFNFAKQNLNAILDELLDL
jgi:leucine-rich repeat-containing protein 49